MGAGRLSVERTPEHVVVIGAGVLGLCTALALVEIAEAGAVAVTVLEQGSIAGASSGLSVGIVETQYLDPLAIEIRVRSMRLFDELDRSGEVPLVRNGYLRLARSAGDLERMASSVEVQRGLGVANARILDAEGLGALVPDMRRDDLLGGLFGPTDGYVDGHRYCGALAQRLREHGVTIRTGVALLGADDDGDGLRLATSDGVIGCDRVVNAAGGWAGRVGDMLGTPVGLLPQRHRALVVRPARPLGYVMPSIMDYVPSSGELGVYVRDDGAGTLVAGLHTEEALHDVVDPDDVGRGDDFAFLETVGTRLADRFPVLAEAGYGDVWAGIYPMCPDGSPMVGPYPGRPAVVAVVGAGGSGIQQSPALGRAAAEWIVYGEPRTIPALRALAPR